MNRHTSKQLFAVDGKVVRSPGFAFNLLFSVFNNPSSSKFQSFIRDHQFLSLSFHSTPLPLMGQWNKYVLPIYLQVWGLKKFFWLGHLPLISAYNMDWVCGRLVNPELTKLREQSGISEMHLDDDWEVSLITESSQQNCSGSSAPAPTPPPPAGLGVPPRQLWVPAPGSPLQASVPPAALESFLLVPHVVLQSWGSIYLLFRVRKMTLLSTQVRLTHSTHQPGGAQPRGSTHSIPFVAFLSNTTTSSSKVLHCPVTSFFLKTESKVQTTHCILRCSNLHPGVVH